MPNVKTAAASFFLIALLAYTPLCAQDEVVPEVERAPAPAWVRDVSAQPFAEAPEDKAHSGIFYQLADYQLHPESESAFTHIAYQFLSEAGVEDNAQITIDFNPAFETLTLHTLRVYRKGEVLERLDSAAIKILERESGLESRIYDGTRTASIVMEDIRVGDVLEYAFTHHGWNPIMEGRFYDSYSTSFSIPVAHYHLRLVWPSDKPAPGIRYENTALRPEIQPGPEGTVYTWEAKDLPVILSDGDLPSSYSPWGWIQFSDYESWNEIARWASAIYTNDEAPPPGLETQLKRLRQIDDPEEQVLAAIRFVQDEIRYLGVFLGEHSHRPYPLSTILKRRFGDCKDKSVLLVALLEGLGYEARPALVDTSYGKVLDEWLPSPGAFDHVIVQLRFQGETYWVDPTISEQRGGLGERFFPDYGYALVVDPATTDLTRMQPSGYPISAMEVTEEFTIPDYNGSPAFLEVLTLYKGDEADAMRSYWKNTSRDRIQKNYLNYYASEYPGIEVLEPLHFEDDPLRNVVQVREKYIVNELLQPGENPETGDTFTDFYAHVIADGLDEPSTRLRTMPFRLTHPNRRVHTILVNFPEQANFETEHEEVLHPALTYRYSASAHGNQLRLRHSLRTRKAWAPASEATSYFESLESIRDLLKYSIIVSDLDKPDEPAEPIAPPTPPPADSSLLATVPGKISLGALLLFLWAGSLLLTVHLTRLQYRRKNQTPPPLPPDA